MKTPTNTAAETGRDTEIDANADAFVPDDNWLEEFTKQLTPALVDGLRNYARMRLLAVAYAGRKVDDYDAREIVQDAIGDTWAGVLRWDPARWSLEYHFVRAIQSRADKARKHAKAHPHDALGDGTESSKFAEREASSALVDDQLAVTRVYSSETMAQIRADAAGDKPVLRTLDSYDAGAQTKEDVLAFTKMKPRTYHNAHVRLKRIVRNLTDRKFAPKARA